MRNEPLIRMKCETCQIKIPKAQPKLRCSFCNKIKHLSCQKLTKADAKHILALKIDWTCKECILNILPINACSANRKDKNKTPIEKFKIKCSVCSGFSYTPRNVRKCTYCDQLVHVKCWNHELGCTSCCEDMFPGFYSYTYEILGDPYLKNDKMYNPYCTNAFAQQIGDIINTEENTNDIFSEVSDILINCKYKQLTTSKPPPDSELSIFSLNVQTLANKISIFRENIELYENFDLLIFNETNCIVKKLPNELEDLKLNGFHEPFVKEPIRSSGKGGGLVIYVNERVGERENIKIFSPCNEIDSNNSGEFQFIKIEDCKGTRKTVIIGNIYRSPSAKPDKFNEFFGTILQKLNNKRYSNKLIYIVGDFNQDLINYDNDLNCQNLIDNAHNSGFVQIISRPTRITERSATLIDLVFTNNIDSALSCNVITLDVSDHLAAHTKISLGSNNANLRKVSAKSKNEKKEFRIFNEANDFAFRNLINSEKWEDVPENTDVQTTFNKFDEIYTDHYNTAYPLNSKRKRRKNERINPKPWILPWLEDACSRKNRLYHEYVKKPTPENKLKYDKLNAFCKKHVDSAKTKYYKSQFEKYKNDSRKQWQIINGLLNRKNKNSNISSLRDSSGRTINTPSDMAESFNNYFSNVASNLKNSDNTNENLSDGTSNYEYYLKSPVSNSIYLNEVDASEVHRTIKNFQNKSTSDTRISALKIANESHSFTTVLAKIINKSFQEGFFPEQLKTAGVVPIHKEGSKSDVSNYRPISLLKTFSKIFEKLMHVRILGFLETNNSLYEMQYGFRPGRSCEHALLNAQNKILDSLSRRQISLLLLIDFSKAFDMVDHSILLKKLDHYGIRGLALQWIKSYLGNRKQYVTVNGTNSTCNFMKFGVPQGSILGPLLFIIYINDIPEIAKYAKFILYADDANIIITASTIEEVQEQLLKLINCLSNWVNCNGLALNLKKTKYMIFSRCKTDLPSPVIISNTLIERKEEARFLGVIIDESLKWTRHIRTVISKMTRYVGLMYKIKKLLPLSARLQIYHSLVQSHINYCVLVWGFSCRTNIEAIFTKQKMGIRAVIPGFVNYKYKNGQLPGHTKSAFSEYKILTIQNLIVLNSLIFIQKTRIFPSFLPYSVRSTISDDSPIVGSTHETCESWLKVYNNNLYNNSVFYKGPLISATCEIDETIPASSFKSLKLYKNNAKKAILSIQGSHDNVWHNKNFILYNISGLRASKHREKVSYTDFFLD